MMRSNRLKPGLCLGALVLAAGAPLLAQNAPDKAPAAPAKPAAAPQAQQQQFGETVVTAQTIDYDLGKKLIIAVGQVVLDSGASHMTSDRMTVQMTANQEMEWAKCEGNVTVRKKDPDGSTLDGVGKTLEYFEKDQKANLQGDVTVNVGSPRLDKPAVVTGSRVDMNLATKENVVYRTEKEQAKVHVEPKGQEGKPTPEPADLIGDQITMNGRTQEYVATGNPLLVRPSSKLRAKKIHFQVDEKTNNIEQAFADDDVIFDGRGENGSVIHTTADNGVYTEATSELVLTGLVHATVQDPNDEKPTVYTGAKFIHNTKTRASRLSGEGKGLARIVLPPGKAPGQKKPEGAGKEGEPGEKDAKGAKPAAAATPTGDNKK